MTDNNNNNPNLSTTQEVFNIWKEWEESSIRNSSTVFDQNYYVTTAINYTNGEPHIGHAYEAIVADIFARYNRIYGRNTFFLTGTDEHGQKIAQAAAAKGITPIELCDGYAEKFQALNNRLYISNNRFIRTTSSQHHELARLILQTSLDNGDIYLGSYTGWYNVREEAFVTENEAKLSNFKDPASGNDLVKMEEETYFFRLSKFREPLIQHITENPNFIQPAVQRDFILKRLEDELLDLSISRTNFKWGVELPNNPDHVMYVWFDALTNYLTGIDWPSGKLAHFWPAALQIVGKDITWFHCVIWPAMLLSAKIPLPATVFGHGFIHDELGRKMSKSLGNVVDPNEVLNLYPADSFRASLIANNPFGGDIPFNVSNLIAFHNSDLADTIGNLVNRCAAICAKNSKGVLPSEEGENIFSLEELKENTEKEYAGCCLHLAYEHAIQSVKSINQYLTTKAPWKIKDPEDPDFALRNAIIRSALEAIYISAHFLAPFIPETASRIFKSVSTPPTAISSLKERNLIAGTSILKFEFKKLELKAKGVTETKEDRKAKAALQKEQKLQKKLQSRAQNQNQNQNQSTKKKNNNNNNKKKNDNNNGDNNSKPQVGESDDHKEESNQ